jgi:acetate kinase
MVVNSGSSSVKFSVYKDEKLLEHKNFEEISSHKEVLEYYFQDKNMDEFDFIVHRVVHGGDIFKKPTVIDKDNIKLLKSLNDLAPLHNPANVEAIEYFLKYYPDIKQVAVFDTSFHQTMPQKAFLYAIDKKYYLKHHIRRYGFHGSSHNYLLNEAAKLLKKDIKKTNLITIHLGNGASICAIKNAKSIDTSMGFTPLEGLVMGSRCGDLDVGIISYMMEKLKLNISEIDKELNKKSGLIGLCSTNDIREIQTRDDEDAKLALEIYTTRVKKYIGSYLAILDNVDAIVFSGGVGENSPIVREKILKGLEKFGILTDFELNKKNHTIISKTSSNIKVFVIKTNEELQMLNSAKEMLYGGK